MQLKVGIISCYKKKTHAVRWERVRESVPRGIWRVLYFPTQCILAILNRRRRKLSIQDMHVYDIKNNMAIILNSRGYLSFWNFYILSLSVNSFIRHILPGIIIQGYYGIKIVAYRSIGDRKALRTCVIIFVFIHAWFSHAYQYLSRIISTSRYHARNQCVAQMVYEHGI